MFARPVSKPQQDIFIDKTDYIFADPFMPEGMKRMLAQKQDMTAYESNIMALFY